MTLKSSNKEIPWWKKTVVYQIYPRSYMDSNGDGIGDLKGIISKLDYIKEMGFETIWFSPFYPSPTFLPYSQHDCGYDIMNYRDVNPEYGTMEDCIRLIDEIHKRDLKIVMDMVMNHTSVEHPWFKESKSSKDNPKRNWYIWRDGKKPKGKKPPNNWRAMPMGSAWKYDEQTEQWYYHQFLPFQPDLNYRNPEVLEEMLNTVRFWLNNKVDGFRLDIINTIYEDPEFRDAPFKFGIFSEDLDLFFKSAKYYLNHPDTFAFCKKLRDTIDEFPGKFMVGEVSASLPTLKKYLMDPDTQQPDRLNLVFQFQSLGLKLQAGAVKKLLSLYENWFSEPLIPTLVFGNHDQFRRISKFGGDLTKAKMNAAIQLTARGVPFIYYGEEIGIENVNLPHKTAKDSVTHHLHQWIPYWAMDFVRKFNFTVNRDDCRTPMQWDASNENAGFSPNGVQTWLPVHPDYKERNVASELQDEDSLLWCYRRFLKARRETPALNSGEFKFKTIKGAPSSVFSYERIHPSGNVLVVLNLSVNNIKIKFPCEQYSLLVSTTTKSNPLDDSKLKLTPWEAIVLKYSS